LTDSEQQQLESNFNQLWYSLRRYYVDQFFLKQVKLLDRRYPVLDLGGHKSRKRGVFNIDHYDLITYYANISPEKGADFLSDAARIASANESYGSVICAELLEHVSDPTSVLRESFRVLRPDGTLLITVPFLYQIHADPHDYGRYTDYFWNNTLHEIGFQQIEIQKQGLFWSVLVDMLRAKTYHMLNQKQIRTAFLRKLISYIMIRAKKYARTKDQFSEDPFSRSFTTGFAIICKK
jgi:SAM-dependent methyltransferase